MTVSAKVEAALAGLAPRGRLLVALSGGADSVAALRVLGEIGRELVAAHFDHRLRAESAEDEAFVRDLCERLGVELVTGSADVAQVARERHWNVENAARRLRYDFLHRAAASAGCTAIVVAHTVDDQAETFLLQALRGSAFPAGMPAKRGLVVRPLLSVGREELRVYLRQSGQTWREDASNRDITRGRAWLRHEVLPLMSRRYPRAALKLATTAAVLADADKAIEQVATQVLGTGSLKLRGLSAAPAALQRAALARLIEAAGVAPSYELIEKVRAAAARLHADPGHGPWRTSLDAEQFLRIAYGRLEVVKRARPPLAEPLSIASTDDLDELREMLARGAGDRLAPVPELPTHHRLQQLLAAHPQGLTARHRLPGDIVRTPAGRKKLADLLIDRKVPAEERDARLLLAADGEVVWLEGEQLESLRPQDRHSEQGHEDASAESSAVPSDRHHMWRALELARAAGDAGELPVGAVVVLGGRELAAAGNRTEAANDPSAHAEVLALREAANKADDWRLEGATLYVTLEPCAMCFGAVLQTRVARVVYGADNLREGALGSVMDLRYGDWKRRPEVEGGLLAKESAELLRSFFAKRR